MQSAVHPKGIRTHALIAAVVLGNVFGNFSLSQGMHGLGGALGVSLPAYVAGVLNPWVGAGVCVLIVAAIAQLSLLSRADLSYVMPVTSVAYIGTAILGGVFLGEHILPTRWLGIGLISIGAALVGRTKCRTTEAPATVRRAAAGR
jgi:drug/metabolite transporter (DMT)-like permease